MTLDELSQATLAFERLRRAMMKPTMIGEMYTRYSLYDEDFSTVLGFLEECRNEIHPVLEEAERG